jgi:hypothetical protein
MTIRVTIESMLHDEAVHTIEIIDIGRYDSRLNAYDVMHNGIPISTIRHNPDNGIVRLVELALARIQTWARGEIHERT